jgi:anti-anti-sigma regulatory factor
MPPRRHDGPDRPECRVLPHPQHTGVRLVGEIDLSTRSVLFGALSSLGVEDSDVYIDVSELTFIDVAGLAELVTFTEERRPHRVVIEAPSTLIRRVAGVLWGDGGLEFG